MSEKAAADQPRSDQPELALAAPPAAQPRRSPDADTEISQLVQAIAEGVVVVDAAGLIVFTNPALAGMVGTEPSELIGRPLTTLIPPRLRAGHVRGFGRFLAEGGGRGRTLRVSLLRADGSELPVEVGFSLVLRGHRRWVAGLVLSARDQLDAARYRHISQELLAVVAEAAGPAAEVVPAVLSAIATGLGFEVATVWRWRPELGLLRCEQAWQADGAHFHGFVRATTGSVIRSGEAVPGVVVARDEPVWVPETAQYPNFRRGTLAAQAGLRSAFAFPIRTRDGVLGVIELFSRAPREPDPPLFEAAAAVAAGLGELIQRLELESRRADLITELEWARRRQEFLLQASQAVAEARGLEETLGLIARAVVPELGDLCLVDMVTPDGRLVRLAAQHADTARQALCDELRLYPPDPDGVHPAALAIRLRLSRVVSEVTESFLRDVSESDRALQLKRLLEFTSYISAPLMVGGRALGAITVVSAGSRRRLGDEELSLLEALTGQVAPLVGQARSFDQQQQVAHALQRSLLPERLEHPSSLSVAARYVAGNEATEVGGDFYDVVPLDDDRVALVIGDIEGHDVKATTVMGQVRSALRAYLEIDQDPSGVLQRLDRYVQRHGDDRLATICLAILAANSATLLVASAGHPPPVLLSPLTAPTTLGLTAGPPLGIEPLWRPAEQVVLPGAGSLLFYTDGLVEDRSGGPDARLARLLGAVTDVASAAVDEICDAALSTATGGASIEDDIALLVVRWG